MQTINRDTEQQLRQILFYLKGVRENKGYTQEYMAYVMGIKQSTYQKMESGAIPLRLKQFLTICKLLDMEWGATTATDSYIQNGQN